MADLTRRVWRAIVWYLREVSGEARYGRYVEHLRAAGRRKAGQIRLHPTGCCC